MRTRIVYVATSTCNDIYLEQVWASAFSLKHFNPTANIAVVCDHATANSLKTDGRENIRTVVDEIIEVDIPEHYTQMQKSRWIKTNLRNLITGDFLFVDSDTIVTGKLDDVDALGCSVGMVLDMHCHIDKLPHANSVKNKVETIYNCKLKPNSEFYNSGVIFAKDDDMGHKLFDSWHENWKIAAQKGFNTDQQPLIKTIDDIGTGIITEIGGEYNAQVLGSIAYLASARIVHFFNTQWGMDTINPFLEKQIYHQIKADKGISASTADKILHCRELFYTPTFILAGKDFEYWRAPLNQVFYYLFRKQQWLYKALNTPLKFLKTTFDTLMKHLRK